MKRHRIVHVLPFANVGGTELGTLRIAKAIDDSRFTNVALCLKDGPAVQSIFESAGIECAVYEPPVPSYRHAARFLSASRKLAGVLQRVGADLVHGADMDAAFCSGLAGRLAGVPVISHVRNRYEDLSRRDRSFLWPVKKFVFVSRDTWRKFGYAVPEHRGTVIYDGIDIPGVDGADRARIRHELGIPADAPVVGMLARVAPQKDFATLARAAARVLAVTPQARFVIVGDYTSEHTYREHYRSIQQVLQECAVSNSFIFTGHRADARSVLAAMDVFVLTTHWEGLPLVILEAMAQGLPVVATAVDGVPEVIQHGETGFLHAHENDEELAAHILTFLHDRPLAERMATAGKESVRTRFGTQRFGDEMNALYAQVLKFKAEP